MEKSRQIPFCEQKKAKPRNGKFLLIQKCDCVCDVERKRKFPVAFFFFIAANKTMEKTLHENKKHTTKWKVNEFITNFDRRQFFHLNNLNLCVSWTQCKIVFSHTKLFLQNLLIFTFFSLALALYKLLPHNHTHIYTDTHRSHQTLYSSSSFAMSLSTEQKKNRMETTTPNSVSVVWRWC